MFECYTRCVHILSSASKTVCDYMYMHISSIDEKLNAKLNTMTTEITTECNE